MASTYVINFTDPTVPSLVITPGQHFDTYSVKLVGQGATEYGRAMNENFLHMLENFSSYTAPTNPLVGQNWYDLNTHQPKTWAGIKEVTTVTTVADVAGNLAGKYFTVDSPTIAYYVWYTVNAAGADPAPGGKTAIGPIDVITNATADQVAAATQGTLNIHVAFSSSVISDVIMITSLSAGECTDATAATSGFGVITAVDGSGWNEIGGVGSHNHDTDYVNITGDTMTGLLVLSADPIVALGASTKQYTDAVQTNLTTHAANTALHLTTFQDALLDGLAGTLTSTELNYVDGVTSPIQTQLNSKVNLSGSVMTGLLTLSGAPSSDLHAATKLYVDSVGIGGSQTWQNVTGSRTASTTYTNTTGEPIQVSIVINGGVTPAGTAALIVDGITIASWAHQQTGGVSSTLSAIVPTGNTYRCTVGGPASISAWLELR